MRARSTGVHGRPWSRFQASIWTSQPSSWCAALAGQTTRPAPPLEDRGHRCLQPPASARCASGRRVFLTTAGAGGTRGDGLLRLRSAPDPRRHDPVCRGTGLWLRGPRRPALRRHQATRAATRQAPQRSDCAAARPGCWHDAIDAARDSGPMIPPGSVGRGAKGRVRRRDHPTAWRLDDAGGRTRRRVERSTSR